MKAKRAKAKTFSTAFIPDYLIPDYGDKEWQEMGKSIQKSFMDAEDNEILRRCGGSAQINKTRIQTR